MPLPTYDNDLVLANVFIAHDSYARMAQITFAMNDHTVNNSAQQWADGIFGTVSSDLKTRLDSNAAFIKCTTLKGDGTSTFTTGESTATAVQGTAPISSVTPQVAMLVRKLTGFGGRINRGRMYLPWMLNEGTVDELGVIDPSWVSDTQDKIDLMFTDLTAGGDQTVVIANRVYDLPWSDSRRKLTAVHSGNEVTAMLVENICATQRRRLVRR